MIDERWRAKRILGRLEISSGKALLKFTLSLAIAASIAGLPDYEGLTSAGQWCLFILLFAAGLWTSEAIPAFAVAVLIIGLEILVLGRPNGVFAKDADDWEIFVEPWASPVIWLFFGGFVLAQAAAKTGLDRWLSRWVIRRCGSDPRWVLLGTMGISFSFSMFISNTATTAMMMAVMTPMVVALPDRHPFAKALLLGIPFAANLGGMGTVIGSPPNAIAMGMLQTTSPMHFLKWMFMGLPPALILAGLAWGFLLLRFRFEDQNVELVMPSDRTLKETRMPRWRRLVVMLVFFVTIGLWMTEPLHGVPPTVASFIPITALTVTGVLRADDIRKLPWDVLLLLTGGLALGVAVTETGLADWLVGRLPAETLGPLLLALSLAYLCSMLSNFMSNTAAANILIPIAAALGQGMQVHYVVPIALAASSAMCLPVSTPPNAIAFSQGKLETIDFLVGGVFIGLLAPVLVVGWCWYIGQ